MSAPLSCNITILPDVLLLDKLRFLHQLVPFLDEHTEMELHEGDSFNRDAAISRPRQ